MLVKMLDCGMDVARLNFSHGDHKVTHTHAKIILQQILTGFLLLFRPTDRPLITLRKLSSRDPIKYALSCSTPRVPRSEPVY